MPNPDSHHSKIEDDILYHLGLILIDLERLKLDFNRTPTIIVVCESLMHKIVLISQLHERYDKPIFKALKNKINELVMSDPFLKGISIHVENSRCKNQNGKIKRFKITV